MYIEEVILEGFKSYATRTVISGWDSEFNAITGLNGTGKSNILDAICFVLGIENLRQVRATALQDLVYKRGQAGITKASVTVVFNNSNPAGSPIGYAECPQITVTRQIILNGKNKYLINGHSAQQKSVENLFQSVQLNVNNPHFLIMQGQITRVLNMKPPETLAMIEESAGTRMFEDRKSKAISTLDRKEKKVDEISALLTDAIEPKLDSLRLERSEFLEYKRSDADLERLERLLKAHEYQETRKSVLDRERFLEDQGISLAELDSQLKASRLEIESLSDEILKMTKRRQVDSSNNRKIKDLEDAVNETANAAVRIQIQGELKKEQVESARIAINEKKQQLLKEESRFSQLQLSYGKVEGKFKEAESELEQLRAGLKREEDLVQSLETGLSAKEDSSATGYAKLITEARDRFSQANTALQQQEISAKALESELSLLEPKVANASKEGAKTTEKLAVLQRQVSALEDECKTRLEPRKDLYEERFRIKSRLDTLQAELDGLQGAFASVDFHYKDPDHNFDRSKVKGVVAQLCHLRDDSVQYATALEIAAGGRLYNVVVEDEKTAAALLDRGKLTRRVTIIPLNKIHSRKVPQDRVKVAESFTQGQAKIGLSLVEFEQEVSAAMEYVFGGTFVCDTNDAANLVAFDRRIGSRAVTIQGDLYEPSGTLSGGSAPPSGNLLGRLQKFRQLSQEKAALEEQMQQVIRQIGVFEQARKQQIEREKALKVAQQDLAIAQRHIDLDSSNQLLARQQAILEQYANLQKSMEKQKKLAQDAQNDCALYEKDSTELSKDRDGKLAQLTKQMTATRSKLIKKENIFGKTSEEYRALQNQFVSCEASISEMKEQLKQSEESVRLLSSELDALQQEHMQLTTQHTGFRVRLETELSHLKHYDEQLKALDRQKSKVEESVEVCSFDREKLQKSIAVATAELEHARGVISKLKLANSWIPAKEAEFGVAGGAYDFKQHNMVEIRVQAKSLQERRENWRKTVNFNVMDMIDRVESKETALKQMLSTVKKDRTKIESTIEKLNDYMLETLHSTWEKVNKDFGEIFGMLLPGSSAKLDRLDGQPLTDGLEIKVCLGGIWKQSLTELSGGQRSLVALSLILALLQFKPAPLYILDEVDAALDLSHTESIGRLLKSRFKGSQFIVVSLKEGMFSNANVLFQTRFRDGISGVERVVGDAQPAKTEIRGGKVSGASAASTVLAPRSLSLRKGRLGAEQARAAPVAVAQ